MAWVKLDDQFPDHPKVVAAGPLAKGLFVDALCYANRLLTDGFIPDRIAQRLASEYGPYTDPANVITKLIDVGLWNQVEGGYQVHDYLHYQPSAAKAKAEKAATAKRQADWRDRHSNGESNAVTNAPVTPAPYPSRSQPDNEQPETHVSGAREDEPTIPVVKAKPEPKPKAHRLPIDWQPADSMDVWSEKLSIPVSRLEHELEQFRDHFAKTGKAYVDWQAAWRGWMRRISDFSPVKPAGSPPPPFRTRHNPNGLTLLSAADLAKRAQEGMRHEPTRDRSDAGDSGIDLAAPSDHRADRHGLDMGVRGRAGVGG